MLLFLVTLGTGMTYIQSVDCWFGGDLRRMSGMSIIFVEYLYNNFSHLITGDPLSLWLPHNMETFRTAIFEKLIQSAVVEEHWRDGNLEEQFIYRDFFDRDSFRLIGFMDDIGQQTCRPGDARQRHFYR